MKSIVTHQIQLEIINILKKKGYATFVELNSTNVSNDWFSYHVRQLVKKGLISKLAKGSYQLSDVGKEFSLNIQEEGAGLEDNPRVSIILICVIDNEFVVQKRMIHPYRGIIELPSMKVPFGSTVEDAIKGCLANELGLSGEPVFKGVNHKIDRKKNQELISDRYFLVYEIININGDLEPVFDDGENFLMSRDEFEKLENTHFDKENILKLYDGGDLINEIAGASDSY